jgi:hypothetical protein
MVEQDVRRIRSRRQRAWPVLAQILDLFVWCRVAATVEGQRVVRRPVGQTVPDKAAPQGSEVPRQRPGERSRRARSAEPLGLVVKLLERRADGLEHPAMVGSRIDIDASPRGASQGPHDIGLDGGSLAGVEVLVAEGTPPLPELILDQQSVSVLQVVHDLRRDGTGAAQFGPRDAHVAGGERVRQVVHPEGAERDRVRRDREGGSSSTRRRHVAADQVEGPPLVVLEGGPVTRPEVRLVS